MEELIDVFEEEDLIKIPDGYENQVEYLETEEHLDNLKYIHLDRNGPDIRIDASIIKQGIVDFREEYKKHYAVMLSKEERYAKLFSPSILEQALSDELLQEEQDFIDHICSLEGKFELHRFSKKEIRANSILKRVLNYRLSILGLLELQEPNDKSKLFSKHKSYSNEMSAAISRLGQWFEIEDWYEIVKWTGDIDFLIEMLTTRERFANSNYAHIIYFFDDDKKIKGEDPKKRRRFLNGIQRFKARTEDHFKSLRRRPQFERQIEDGLNKLVTRVIQIKLWLLGTYEGQLDSDIKEISIQAIKDFIDYFHSIHGKYKLVIPHIDAKRDEDIHKNKAKFRNHYLSYELLLFRKETINKGNYVWALNATLLLGRILPFLSRENFSSSDQEVNVQQDPEEPQGSLSGRIDELSDDMNIEEKKYFYAELNKLIKGKMKPAVEIKSPDKKRKARVKRTRGSKSFFKSIGNFFKKVIKKTIKNVVRFIKSVINKIISFLKKLFKWLKNGVMILIREIKNILRTLRKALQFAFGKRIIQTGQKQQQLTTDFDFDFDVITTYSSANQALISKHLDKVKERTIALEKSADFLGEALYIAIQLAQPGIGWIRVGIHLVRLFAGKVFRFPQIGKVPLI